MKPVRLTTTMKFKASPERLWGFLADTDRLNRALKFPSIRFVPSPDPSKKGHYHAHTSFLGMKLNYEEFPFDWVEGRYHRVVRRFHTGPIKEIMASLELKPESDGTLVEIATLATPRGRLGGLFARLAYKGRAAKEITKVFRALERHFLNAEIPPPALPPNSLVHWTQLEARLSTLKTQLPSSPLLPGLKTLLSTGSDLEVTRIRPFELAERWGSHRMETLHLFLQATKAGLVNLTWNVLCPECRAPNQSSMALAELKSESHCPTCNIKYGTDFASSVEVRFSVHPAVRTAREAVYCIGGPANTPHIIAQLRLLPGERREESLPITTPTIRLRSYQLPGLTTLRFDGDQASDRLTIRCALGGLEIRPAALRSGTITLEADNPLPHEVLLVVERETWQAHAATAAMVTALQEFRNLFPYEAVAPGEQIGIASITALFTDLKSSTRLYQNIGDPPAFHFVQRHFRYLLEISARHQGHVVKTMGDAILAVFFNARDALHAALEMQDGWEEFSRSFKNDPVPLLKIGLHQGPAIAINNRGQLDYFGATINMAARIETQSEGGDVVCSGAVLDDPDVTALLSSIRLTKKSFEAELKGVEGRQRLYQLRKS